MLNAKSIIRSRSIEIAPHKIEILFGDNGAYPVSLVLPSASEIADLRSGSGTSFSIRDILATDPLGLSECFQKELERQSLKYDRYGDSSTYLMNMFGLSRLAGDSERAEKYLKEAVEIDDDPALLHKLGDYLISVNKGNNALELFSSCDLQNDIYANIRMAYFEITRNNNVTKALEYVKSALEIDLSDYKAQMFAGALYISVGEFEKAVRAFRVAEMSNQRSSTLHVNKAVAYWGMGYKEKAEHSLRLAVAINPLNENAVAFYSEVIYQSGRVDAEEKAIKALERIIEYEQTNPQLWLALARAYYFKGEQKYKLEKLGAGRDEFLSALSALKKAESSITSAGIWNNIALVFWRTGEYRKSGKYFMQSLKVAYENGEDDLLPLYNLIGLLIETKQYREALQILSERVADLTKPQELGKYESRIALQFVLLLEAAGQREEAINFTKILLHKDVSESDVVVDLLTRSLAYYTVNDVNADAAEHDANLLMQKLSDNNDVPKELRDRAINNVVFSLLCSNRVDDADKLLSKISSRFHIDPYATATLGLYQIKKGKLAEGERLYREAISLVVNKKEHERFRQRMHYELGKASINIGEYKKAEKHFQKALKQKEGLHPVKLQIQSYMRQHLPKLN